MAKLEEKSKVTGFEVDGISVEKDEALVVYHAGPNRFGQFSMTLHKWDSEQDIVREEFMTVEPEHVGVLLRQYGLKLRVVDERSGAMR